MDCQGNFGPPDQFFRGTKIFVTGHRIDWEGVEVLEVASDHQERLVKEAVYIRLSTSGVRMNRDEGEEIWQGPLKKLRCRDNQLCSADAEDRHTHRRSGDHAHHSVCNLTV